MTPLITVTVTIVSSCFLTHALVRSHRDMLFSLHETLRTDDLNKLVVVGLGLFAHSDHGALQRLHRVHDVVHLHPELRVQSRARCKTLKICHRHVGICFELGRRTRLGRDDDSWSRFNWLRDDWILIFHWNSLRWGREKEKRSRVGGRGLDN